MLPRVVQTTCASPHYASGPVAVLTSTLSSVSIVLQFLLCAVDGQKIRNFIDLHNISHMSNITRVS
jgi:hypothetical protein